MTDDNEMKSLRITRISGGRAEEADDPVAVEARLNLSVNGSRVLSMSCTPSLIRELVAGFVMTEGIIEGSWCADRMSIEYGEDINVDIPSEGKVSLEGASFTSGCAKGISMPARPGAASPPDDFRISSEVLLRLFKDFRKRSELHDRTGGVHSAAIASEDGIVFFAEDIGRHNAVDKVIGHCLLEGHDLSRHIVLSTGRLSSEICAKCSRWGVPVLSSIGAPTTMAVETAAKAGVTIVGFVRAGRMNVYTRPERIIP